MQKAKLLLNALTKFLCGLLLVGALLFLPAGSFAFTGGWIFIGLLFIPMLILGAALLIKSPELLQKRLDAKEKRYGFFAIITRPAANIGTNSMAINSHPCG